MRDWKRRVTPEALPESYQKFVEVLGAENTLKLCEVFGGEEVYIPKLDAAYNTVRDAEIARRYKDGESVKSLCGRFGIRRRTLYDILNKNTTKDRKR